MKIIKSVIVLFLLSATTQANALECVAMKNGEVQAQLKGAMTKSAIVDTYQFDAIEVDSNTLVLVIFDRRTPTSSARSITLGRLPGQILVSQLETVDGSYQVRCQ